MLQRAQRSAAFVLCAWGSLFVGILWVGIPPAARADDLSIHFDEIEAHARTESPQVQILAQELEKLLAERDAALQWSNPDFGYDHEEGGAIREWQLTLRKKIVMPFSQSTRKAGWESRTQSGELRVDEATVNLLSELRSGYVHLRLLDSFLTHIDQLRDIVMEASAAAAIRHDEGDISGVENHLIQLTALSLDAGRRKAQQERMEAADLWQVRMGVPRSRVENLATPIAFQTVELESPTAYLQMLENRPGLRSLVALEQALDQQAAAAQPSLIPGFDVYVGFKHFAPDNDGFVAGVSLSLPVFDRDAAAARQHRAEQRIVETQQILLRAHSTGEIETLVHMIEDARRSLSIDSVHFDGEPSVMSDLLFAYQDGRLALNAFLGAIQIEVAGSRDYYDQLANYYRNIFRLEAITGTELVSFER